MSAIAGRVLPLPKGVYNAETTYYLLDIVYYNNASYICKKPSLGNLPTDTEYFQVLVDVPSTANVTPEGLGIGYGVSDTVESDVRKLATLTDYNLRVNGIVAIKFANNVPYNSLLNINNKGAKPIFNRGLAITDGTIKAGDTVTFVYDGTNYNLLTIDRAFGSIGDLDNVDLTGVSDDDTLVYDAIESKFKPGSQTKNIGDLNDVNIASATDGDVLTYDNGEWKNDGSRINGIDEHLDSLDDEVSAIVNVYGSKNLNSYPYYSTTNTLRGVVWTDKGNGIINADGTATSGQRSSFLCHYLDLYLKNGTYILSGCPSGGSGSTYYMYVSYTDSNNTTQTFVDYGQGVTFTINGSGNDANGVKVTITIETGVGAALSNLDFEPMIRDARISDEIYVSYAPTNRELMSYKANGKVGAKNLNSYPYYQTTKTQNGITFTDNGDGTITASGIASADTIFRCHYSSQSDFKLKAGDYILSGCPAGGSSSSYYLTNGYQDDYGSGVNFSRGSDSYISVTISVKNGTNLSTPITFKPMIRIAEDTDPTYQPYAKTNRELTEDVAYLTHHLIATVVADGTKTMKQLLSELHSYLDDMVQTEKAHTIIGIGRRQFALNGTKSGGVYCFGNVFVSGSSMVTEQVEVGYSSNSAYYIATSNSSGTTVADHTSDIATVDISLFI